MSQRKRILILSIIMSSIFVTLLIVEIVLSVTGVAAKIPVLSIIFIVFVALFAVLGTAFLIRLDQLSRSTKQLMRENLYNFGKAIEFYDSHAFEAKVTILSKTRKAKSKKQFIIAFSSSTHAVMQNIDRDESYSQFHGKTAELIEELFSVEKNQKRENSYCFDDGVFLLYFFSDDEHNVRDVVNQISDGLLKIKQEGNFNSIAVNPFFGAAVLTGADSVTEVIENANIARNVSERNFETITFYRDDFRKHTAKSEIDEITNGLANGEFVVYYQPKFSLTSKRFVSSEALVRWNSKKLGLLSPAKFIPIAEEAGLIHEIDTYVFKKVCEDLNDAKRRGRRIIPVSINFSLYEFYSTNFLNSILSLLDEYKISPSHIEIEITEATSQANTFLSVSIIKRLRDRGIRVLMDDFGVGFSNIGNLRKIPFDAVKIDKSFIDDIAIDSKSRAIVKFLIELCQANDLEVIAEGVDNKDQNEILKKFKCNTIQGFYYSKALPVKEYEKFLLSNPFEKKVSE